MGLIVTTQPTRRLALFTPPYDCFTNIDLSWIPKCVPPRGLAIVWWLTHAERQQREFQWLSSRPYGVPLIVVLPPASDIDKILPLLHYIPSLDPRAVLPSGKMTTPRRLRQLLGTAPQSLASALIRYLVRRGFLGADNIRKEAHQVLNCAPAVTSVSKLARRLCVSRRTLGRHFSSAGLPVPSHWLQFGRLMYVAVRLQAQTTSIARIASRANYPDGFTLSNQMKRLLGHRPSDVRQLLGWEWLVEAWIRQETQSGGFDTDFFRDAVRPYLDQPPKGDQTVDDFGRS